MWPFSHVREKGFFMDIQDCPRFGFVPKKLDVPGVQKLSVFSYNILFQYKWNSSFYAVYVPHIETYVEKDGLQIMMYFNEGDPRARVILLYDPVNNHWHAEKYFDSDMVGQADGNEWNKFFIHLTLLGCDKREKMTSSSENDNQNHTVN